MRLLGSREGTEESIEAWKKVQAALKKDPTTFVGGPIPELSPGTEFVDLNPPPTFLVSLDGPIDGYTTNGAGFFGSGGIDRPIGLAGPLNSAGLHFLFRHYDSLKASGHHYPRTLDLRGTVSVVNGPKQGSLSVSVEIYSARTCP